MAGEIDFPAVNGISKRVYDRAIKNLLPTSSIVQRRWALSAAKKLGDTYQKSVTLVPPNGVTYEGSAGLVNTLIAPANMVNRQASVPPFAMTLREQAGITALSRLQAEGEGAIASLVSTMMVAMKSSISNRLEATLLLGQRPYGVVESVTGTDAVSMAVVFTEASWRPGMWWAFNRGSTWSTFTAAGAIRSNTAGAITLTSINAATRTVTFAITGTVAGSAVATDTFHPFSARTGAAAFNEMPGLITQAANTSGVSLGIDAALFPNWAGNTDNIGGILDYAALEDRISRLRDRGADGTLVVFVPNKLWSALSLELLTGRMLDSSYTQSVGKTGVKSLNYTSADVGSMEIINHPFMAQGEALIVPDGDVDRVGSQEITFGLPGVEDGPFWERIAGVSAAELQCYTDQAIINSAPGHSYLVTGITYS